MDLKELRYYRAVAEFGTFAKAAAHLRVAQSALSRQVKKLEDDLGVQLLVRAARGVAPTPAGKALLQRAQKIENEIELTRREVSAFATEVTGSLRIGAAFPIAQLLIPALVARYRDRFPHVRIELAESASGIMTDGLLVDQLDVAIIEPPSHPHADLTFRPLWLEKLRFVAPVGDQRFAGRTTIALEEIATLPLILPDRHNTARRLVENAFARRHLECHVVMDATGASMILELVKAGQGYTLMPNAHTRYVSGTNELMTLDTVPAILRSVGVAVRTGAFSDGAIASFLEMLEPAAARFAAGEDYTSFEERQIAALGSGTAVEADPPVFQK